VPPKRPSLLPQATPCSVELVIPAMFLGEKSRGRFASSDMRPLCAPAGHLSRRKGLLSAVRDARLAIYACIAPCAWAARAWRRVMSLGGAQLGGAAGGDYHGRGPEQALRAAAPEVHAPSVQHPLSHVSPHQHRVLGKAMYPAGVCEQG